MLFILASSSGLDMNEAEGKGVINPYPVAICVDVIAGPETTRDVGDEDRGGKGMFFRTIRF